MNNKPSYIGSQVGYITISEDQAEKITNEVSYEVAAWGTSEKAVAGTYPIFIGWNHYSYQDHLTLYAKVDGVITSNYTPSMFGGVRCGSDDGSKEVGKKTSFSCNLDFLDSVKNNQSRFGEYRIFLAKSSVLKEAIERKVDDSRKYKSFVKSELEGCVGKCNWSMVSHYAKILDKLTRQLDYSAKAVDEFTQL
jgi:hypothetical protein